MDKRPSGRKSVFQGARKEHLDFSSSLITSWQPNQEPLSGKLRWCNGRGELPGCKAGHRMEISIRGANINKEYFIFLDAHFMPSPLSSKCYTPCTVTLEIHSAVSYKHKHKFIAWSTGPFPNINLRKLKIYVHLNPVDKYLEWFSSESPQTGNNPNPCNGISFSHKKEWATDTCKTQINSNALC